MKFTVRKATMADIPAIERVMRDSLLGLSSRTYDAVQVRSSLQFIGHIDEWLIEDGTYFVAEAEANQARVLGWKQQLESQKKSGG